MVQFQDGKITVTDFKVTQRHLIDSIRSTHPSLSGAEKEKYTRMLVFLKIVLSSFISNCFLFSCSYARFTGNDNFMEDLVKNQKATLA